MQIQAQEAIWDNIYSRERSSEGPFQTDFMIYDAQFFFNLRT